MEILSPAAGSGFAVQELIPFHGFADDADDGFLDGDSLTWWSDKNGLLGKGADLPFSGVLSLGQHTIILKAEDADHNISIASIKINIYEKFD